MSNGNKTFQHKSSILPLCSIFELYRFPAWRGMCTCYLLTLELLAVGLFKWVQIAWSAMYVSMNPACSAYHSGDLFELVTDGFCVLYLLMLVYQTK